MCSEKQLKSRFQQWGFDVKNIRADTMVQLARTQAKRSLDNKKSSFRVNKKPVDERKIDRFLQRKDISEEELLSMASPVNGRPLKHPIESTRADVLYFSTLSRFQCFHSPVCSLTHSRRRLFRSVGTFTYPRPQFPKPLNGQSATIWPIDSFTYVNKRGGYD
jgi:hypothetical protein